MHIYFGLELYLRVTLVYIWWLSGILLDQCSRFSILFSLKLPWMKLVCWTQISLPTCKTYTNFELFFGTHYFISVFYFSVKFYVVWEKGSHYMLSIWEITFCRLYFFITGVDICFRRQRFLLKANRFWKKLLKKWCLLLINSWVSEVKRVHSICQHSR